MDGDEGERRVGETGQDDPEPLAPTDRFDYDNVEKPRSQPSGSRQESRVKSRGQVAQRAGANDS